MKNAIALILITLTMAACTTAQPQPSRLKEVMRADGTTILIFVPGYSIEDFLCEWEYGKEKCKELLNDHKPKSED